MSETLFWGGLDLPLDLGSQHFCVLGASGSGKSVSLTLLMKSLLPSIRSGSNRRALIYDAKRDIYASLIGMGLPRERIVILNPFDARAAAWDLARDITSPAIAMEMGTILVPEKDELQPFFPEAARSLLGGVMQAFLTLSPGRWTLRDVVLALRTEDRLKVILGRDPNTRPLITQYLGDSDMHRSVTATVANTMRRLAFVAAAWDRTVSSVSLRDFLREERIFLLGRNPSLNSTVQQINTAILHRLSQLILQGEEAARRDPPPQTWIIIDELRNAGRFEVLPSFMVEGRSKGACIAVGFQDLPGLDHVYGQNLAREIIGACRNKAFLKLSEDETAKFASGHFGEHDIELTQHTWNTSRSFSLQGTILRYWQETGRSMGLTQQKTRRTQPAVMYTAFLGLPEASFGNGICGYYDTPSVGAPYFHTLSGEFLCQAVPRQAPGESDFVERPVEHEILREWDPADLARLDLARFPELLPPNDPPPPSDGDAFSKLPKGKK